ncbi:MAG: ATP-binding cassette domain-containing protein [Bdellovibrionales bacterium]|nr:ATP-binding cassette domain-containing protein [Bdellovibrionales bacterium]
MIAPGKSIKGWYVASPAIELINVSLVFNGRETVLENINLKVETGEKLVVIGPSGEGKSVLLKIIGGILPPTSGEVLIQGQNINKISSTQRDKILRKMGMLFQKNALFDSLTSAENIAFPMREVLGIDEKEIAIKVDQFLEAVAIPHAKNLYPDEISGGMQKRLGIARALALNPEIILYDDPTAGLDPITSRMIIQLIKDLQKQRNSTLVAITNDMMRAYQMADRIAMVVDRELIITGNETQTKNSKDPRVHQFIRGQLEGPLTESP